MNPLASQSLDNLLTELAQPDAVEREGRMLLCDAKDVALSRVGVHTQQQVGRREIEQAQSVRLRDLR